MSYLHPVRLHFAGRFQADPSTVNNTTQYYDNANFKEEYQTRGVPFGTLGAWNPEGSSAWRLVDCRVTRVCYADGTSTADRDVDPVVGLRVADANTRVAGKLVDLDPQQQMASEIWALLVRLTDGTADLFSGRFETAPFTNLWRRAVNRERVQQQPLAAVYQSVLTPVTWGDDRGSRFLRELRGAAPELLSMKFNVDGYERDWTLPTFTLGRITGTIGPALPGEPHRFVLGRQLGGSDARVNFMPAVVDPATRRVIADFGNSFQTALPGSDLVDIGTVSIGWVDEATSAFTSLGDVPYRDADWYASTAGVNAYPLDRPLSDDELSALAKNPLAVSVGGKVVLQENAGGVYVRADQFVYRLSPGESAEVELYATRYGTLSDGEEITVSFDASRLQMQVDQGDPAVATPTSAVTGFDSKTPIVAAGGRAVLRLSAHDPKNPRGYIDGQVYGVRPVPKSVADDPAGSWINPSDFVSLLVWDAYDIPEAPAWYSDMQPIFTQYGNLYPLMDKLLDLTDYDAVAAHAQVLTFVFGLPVGDPNSMPVTRDLSPAKRAAVLKWLTTPGPDGLPLKGTPPPPAQEAAVFAIAPDEAPVGDAAAETRSELFLMKSGVAERKE